MVGVVEADTDEFSDPADTGAKARQAVNPGQVLNIQSTNMGEVLRRQRLASDIGNMPAQVTDMPVSIQKAGLFRAGCPIS